MVPPALRAAVRLQIHDHPFRVGVFDGGVRLAELSALFVETGTGRLGLSTWKASTAIPGGRRMLFVTSDERMATVEVRENSGVVLVRFHLEEKKENETLGASFLASPGERFFGLVERHEEGRLGLDLRGQRVEMLVQREAGLFQPFYFSSVGYGVLVDGTWPGYYDMAASHADEVFLQWEGPELNLVILPGPEPAKILAALSRTIGAPPLPSRWAFGNWLANHSSDVSRLEALGIPLQVVCGEPGQEKPDGKDLRRVAAVAAPLADYSQPAAVNSWQDRLKRLLTAGFRGFHLSRDQGELPLALSVKMHNGRSARENHNDHDRLYQQAAFDVGQAAGGDFVLLAKTGYTGSQRLAFFGGADYAADESGLRAALIASQRAALMGFPYWGAEVRLEDREMGSRWLAFGAFQPLFRVASGPPRDPELLTVWRLYARLRQRLMDYSLRAAQQSVKTGLPLIRPMFVAEPKEAQTWDRWQQFFYGNDILVGVVWQKGQNSFPMFLPQGKWVDAWSGKEFSGPTTVTVEAPLHKLPLFLRRNARGLLGDLNAEWAAAQKP